MMLPRRRLLAASVIALAAPKLARAADQTVLRFVPQSDVSVLDLIATTASVTRNQAFLIFDTLYG